MRGHDPDNTAAGCVETSSDDSKDDVLGSEDTGDLGDDATTRLTANGTGSSISFHDADRGGSSFLHESSSISN